MNRKDRKVIDALQVLEAVDRRKIVAYTNMPRSTVYDCLVRLQLKGIVSKRKEYNNRAGRPIVLYFMVNYTEVLVQ